MTDHSSLRHIFDPVAREYDAIRPGYPAELIEDILTLAATPPGGRLLEVGCGTGQATRPFALRGYQILCLDIGAGMLAVAAENLRDFPGVRFQQAAFEDWPGEPAAFDLVYSATAFHWIPNEVGYPKAAGLLKPAGALAIFSNEHPDPYRGFFEEVEEVYRRYDPAYRDPRDRPGLAERIRRRAGAIDATGLFAPVILRTYPWTRVYTTAEYIRLINTYSGHLAIPEGPRRALYEAIASLIDTRYGGSVEKEYLAVLYLARKAG